MKRDLNIVYQVLRRIEELPPGEQFQPRSIVIENVEPGVVAAYLDMLFESGFVYLERDSLKSFGGMTWNGFDLLEKLDKTFSNKKGTVKRGDFNF